MKRNQESQRSINDFMGGYSNVSGGPRWMQQYTQQSVPRPGGNPYTNILNLGGNSSSNTPGGNPYTNILNPTGNSSSNSPMGGGIMQKLRFFTGDSKKVRLFQNCVTDSAFQNGWYDVISPNKNKTLRLQLGKKGTTKNDDLSAIYIPKGFDVVIHEHTRSDSRFDSGKHKLIRSSVQCLAKMGWNDSVSEIDIIPQTLMGLIQNWENQVNKNPIQTLGNYSTPSGTSGVSTGTQTTGINRPVKTNTVTSLTSGNQPSSTGSTASTGSTGSTSTYTAATNPSSWSAPSSTSTGRTPSDVVYMPDYNEPIMGQPSGIPQGNVMEEDSMWKNPLVWGGIAVVVIGVMYMMTRKKKGVKIVSSTKKARHGMKVRSGRKK